MKLIRHFMQQISDSLYKSPNTSQHEESTHCIDVAPDDNIHVDADLSDSLSESEKDEDPSSFILDTDADGETDAAMQPGRVDAV